MTIGKWIIEAEKRGTQPAVQYKLKDQWQNLNWSEFTNKIIATHLFLKSQGIKKGDHIGLMAATSWQWATLDQALLGSGSVVVPMYPNLSDDDLTFIINHSEITSLIIDTDQLKSQIERIRPGFTREVKLLTFSEISFDSEINQDQKNKFFGLCKKLDAKSVATIVYTSGTTGKPKGAVLLHEAIVSEVTEGFELFGVKPQYKSLTFLPFAHVLGRIEHWGSCWNGHCLAYAESIEKIQSNLKEVKPDFLIAVPRIFEKVYSGIMTEVETKTYKEKIFKTALESAREILKYRRTKETIPWPLLIKYEALSKIAFAPIRAAFGGNIKFAISGGAPISQELVEFFNCCGIPISEGYGLTETCAAVTVNTISNNQAGTVGRPIGDVEIKFAVDGEILIKSKKCLVEYYKNPEETKKSIVDGFFATGDIGLITEQGFLKITDRKKDLIKTAGGKYVAPQKLEGLLKQDPLISQVLIHGDQRKFISVLVTFDEPQLKQWARSQQVTFENVSELYQNPILKLRVRNLIQDVNSKLASFEVVKKFEIVTDSWTVENGSLTPSLKVKRKYLESKYGELLDEIYE